MLKREKTRVNVKARFKRHLRIVKKNIWENNVNNNERFKEYWNHHYNLVLFLIIFILPIYPTFASFIYNTSKYEFYRWNIDESSILESYFWWEDEETELNTPIFEELDSFISVNTILDDERDLEWTNEIVEYEVKPGESYYSISYKFRVSTNSIYWANNFTKSHTLQPWEVIKVPPVTWLIHQVINWDTVSSIAKKYDTPEKKIKEQNAIEDWWKLIAWEVLVIPDAIKKVIKPVYKKPKKTYKKSYSFVKWWSSQYVKKSGSYKLVRRKPYSWVWWNCTRYVAQYKNVNWRWNANRWIKNAKAKWHATWSVPKIWSIVQFTGRWYNPRYGHVWIVMDITNTHIIVSDMNYRRLNEVTYRKVLINDRTVDWYIYID